MGFSLYYRSTRPVGPDQSEAIQRDAELACRGHTWLGCEPVHFYPDPDDGHLSGGSKPTFIPHPDDVASAAREGLPDGTTRDLIDILCRLSRDHGVDWEISHDASPEPIGHIKAGVCDGDVLTQAELLAEIGDLIAGDMEGGADDRPD